MKTTRQQFTFGYDLEAVQEVERHVTENYSITEYEMFVGRGDDAMNALEIDAKPDDQELMTLIQECDGQGDFSE